MSSEQTRSNVKKTGEGRLYEPIKEFLSGVFANSYVSERIYQREPSSYQENPYLEITANKRSFSEKLKKEFNNDTLNILRFDKSIPDIMGFVVKKPVSKKDKRELIVVEIKDVPIKLWHIAKAKFYQDLFDADFGLLISSKGISEENLRFVIGTDVGRKSIRGKVIVGQYFENPYQCNALFKIDDRLKDTVPEPFKRFCKP